MIIVILQGLAEDNSKLNIQQSYQNRHLQKVREEILQIPAAPGDASADKCTLRAHTSHSPFSKTASCKTVMSLLKKISNVGWKFGPKFQKNSCDWKRKKTVSIVIKTTEEIKNFLCIYRGYEDLNTTYICWNYLYKNLNSHMMLITLGWIS